MIPWKPCCYMFGRLRRSTLGTIRALNKLTEGNPRALAEFHFDLRQRYPSWLIERLVVSGGKCPCQDETVVLQESCASTELTGGAG